MHFVDHNVYLADLFVTFVPCAPVCHFIYSLTQMSSAKGVIQMPNTINFMIFFINLYTISILKFILYQT